MKQDKWIEQLRDKLADHEMAAPEGLWADIEAAIAQQPKSPKARFVTLRRWTAAAAVAALMAGGGWMWWSQAGHQPPSDTALSELTPPQDGADKPTVPTSEDGSPSQPAPEDVALPHQRPTVRQQFIAQTASTTPIQQPTALADTTIAEAPADNTAPASDIRPSQRQESTPLPPANREELMMPQTKRKTKPKPSVSLYAMNSFSDQSHSNGVLMAEAQTQRFANVYEQSNRMLARSHEPIYLAGYEERQHHDQPISYGLTLNYPLTPRLSLTPGVTYTRLRSDFTQIMRSQQVHQTQKLDYVGIVAGANYRLWDVGRFKCYVAAGVKADLNVATHTETEGVSLHLDKDRLQWSVSGGLGAQYDVIPWLGLYVEPGLSYYPDNGSRIENYFKDKPLNFSLQLGLRLNLK